MSLRKLKGIRSVGAYTVQRTTVENLLVLGSEIEKHEAMDALVKNLNHLTVLKIKSIMKEKIQSCLKESLTHEEFRQYLRISIEQNSQNKSPQSQTKRSIYTSALFNYLDGNQPFEIDLQNQPCDKLLLAIDSRRPIHIQNLSGDWNFQYAGAYDGQAFISVKNITGNFNFHYSGAWGGNAQIEAQNITGGGNFRNVGYYHGTATINVENIEGEDNFPQSGTDHGRATINVQKVDGYNNFHFAGADKGQAHITVQSIVGYNNFYGAGMNGRSTIIAKEVPEMHNFRENNGTLIIHNYISKGARIERLSAEKKQKVLELITQNTPSEDIMAYLRRST